MNLEKAKQDAERFAPEAAQWEAEYMDLKRREPSVLAKCIQKHESPMQTYQWAKNRALNDSEYLDHLESIKVAQKRFLEAEMAFKTVIEYLKAVTSENYKENSKFKAGIL